MSVVIGTAFGPAVRSVGMPRGMAGRSASRLADTRPVAEDGYRYRAIGSFQALGLAIGASVMVTGLLWIVL
ncbi:hypothetical protein FPV16_19045 [Methylobacterium sp. W2]|uniref:hypothetical protein n=1 Tax=Methylobacterium sp. W2 TaxID=2598107 RepID=UPI001D0C6375|nr:hypothetical protein [Methylobacterium sp. W2]MCC0808281.1 hypothetical protein [Methylobacterium sp. W2]